MGPWGMAVHCYSGECDGDTGEGGVGWFRPSSGGLGSGDAGSWGSTDGSYPSWAAERGLSPAGGLGVSGDQPGTGWITACPDGCGLGKGGGSGPAGCPSVLPEWQGGAPGKWGSQEE